VPHKVLFIFGTRPEAIKLAPLVRKFRERPGEMDVRVCVTAQHREMLDQVLKVFDITPDYDLNAMTPGQTLSQSTGRILMQLEPILRDDPADMILVQGDTTTTFCGALAGFYANIPVGHVEAGLRTNDMREPFPEEMNRVVVSRLAEVHFAATAGAASHLYAEGIQPDTVHVTGNTGIDAVLYIRDRLINGSLPSRGWDFLNPSKKLILVTAHRRESFGAGFENICAALRRIADMSDVQVVYPVHPNPNVSGPVRRNLQDHPNIHLIEPLDYVSFVDLMRRSYLLLTDSGGVQEEAPSLGKPVLVMREKTERPEAVEAGTTTLVGVDTDRIVDMADWLIRDATEYERRAHIHNPYGDGRASERIASVILGRSANRETLAR
jgi:UDP-N-acetylglucosamine 2-epimerase (non-hydrolysing)